MKKKIVALISSAFLLVGCGSKNTSEDLTFHEHTFSNIWSKNEISHWHASTCEHKNITKDLGDHVDENKDGKCDVCKYVFNEEEIHEHTFADEWSTDDTSHWRVATCGHDELTKDFGKHVDRNKDHNCDVCKKVISECYDEDLDHKCDYCSQSVTNHVDRNKDHICDICEVKFTDCVDYNTDNRCDICGEPIDITIEPVTKDFFVKGVEALKGNFTAEVEDEHIYNTSGVTLKYSSKGIAEHDKQQVTHAKVLEKKYKKTIDIELFSDILGDDPTQEQIDEFVENQLYDEDFLTGFYYKFRDSDKIIHEDGSSIYSIEAKQTDSIGARFDAMKPIGSLPDYQLYDYVDIYTKSYLDYFNEFVTLGKKEHYLGKGELIGNELINLICDSSKVLDSATYVPDEKTYIFEEQALSALLNSDEYFFHFPGSFFLGGSSDLFKEGKLIVDFTNDNQVDSISFNAKFLDDSEIKLNANITVGGEDIVVPEFDYDYCDHPEHYLRVKGYGVGHYLYCTKCDSVLSYEEHDYDEKGICNVCGHECHVNKSLDGKIIEGYPKELSVAINPYTDEILSIRAPYDFGYSKIDKNLLGDLSKFLGVSETVWAPDDYEALEAYYVLDTFDEYITNGCHSLSYEKYVVYKIDGGVASLFMEPVYHIDESERHSINVNPKDLEKVGDRTLIGTCFCEDCGKEFECFCEANIGVWQVENNVDVSKVDLYITYKDENGKVYEASILVDPIYDENGFDFYTGYHTYYDAYYVDSYLMGYIYYDRFGDVSFGGCKFNDYCDYTTEGDTDVYTLRGTPEDVTIQARIDTIETKNPETCLAISQQIIMILNNGDVVDTFIANTAGNSSGELFDHSFEYVEGSYKFDELLNMYVCEFYCPDCKKTFTLFDVKVDADKLEDKHLFSGFYFEEIYGECIKVTISLEEDCVPNPDDEGHCLICGQEID